MLTRKNLEKLCKNCNFNPTDVGIAILKFLNYPIEQYQLSGALYVLSKDGKKILYDDPGAYVD